MLYFINQLVSITVSVISGIILYYIYKWLDRND